MGRKRKIRAQRKSDPTPVVITSTDGTEHLWEKKIKQELMTQMMREHLEMQKKELGIDEAKKQAYLFFDQSGNEWVEHV